MKLYTMFKAFDAEEASQLRIMLKEEEFEFEEKQIGETSKFKIAITGHCDLDFLNEWVQENLF